MAIEDFIKNNPFTNLGPGVNPFSIEASKRENPMMQPQEVLKPTETASASSTPVLDSILTKGFNAFQPASVNFSSLPTTGGATLSDSKPEVQVSAVDGLKENFGALSGSPFDISNKPSNPFEIDVFKDSAFNSPEVDASLIGFQNPESTFMQTAQSLGSNFTQDVQDQPISFRELASQMATTTSQPIVSSTQSPGLEPFNRFNPTTQQFEQLFGNIPAKNQFEDSEQFVRSIRDEAQRNATNFIGQPVTQTQIDQANQLAREIGVTPNFQVDASGNLAVAEYGTDFATRSPEEINRLLNMRNIQSRQAAVTSPYFRDAMAERDAPLIKSRENFERQSSLRDDRIRDRDAARGSVGRTGISQSEARDLADASRRGASTGDIARGIIVQDRINARKAGENLALEQQELTQSANAVKNFFNVNKIGKELSVDDVRMLIKATGSPQAAIKTYGDLLENLSQADLNDANTSIANMSVYGAELETPKMFRKLSDGSTRMLALNQKTGNWGEVDIDGTFIPVNINDYRETTNTEISTARTNALELLNKVYNDDAGIKQLRQFKQDRIESQEGLSQFITAVQDRFKTAFNMPISEQGMKDAIARAGFERLLGVIRLDVLGPGVLTEQDAIRLMAAMGGFGGLADRETSVALIERLVKSKERAIEGRISVYNHTKDAFKELRDELPVVTPDNIDEVRKGQNINQGDSGKEFDPDSLLK